jgi:hypothetical protein
MDKKQNLINSLRLAVNALKNGTIHYSWVEQSSCNAGVVSQAVLGITREELQEKRLPLFKALQNFNEGRKTENGLNELNLSWKNAIGVACPITGKNLPQIIIDLENAGLRREDISHLEYLSNPAILKESGIPKVVEKIKIQIGEECVTRMVPDTSLYGKLIGKKVAKTFTSPIYKEEIKEKYSKKYYAEKENLILYLSAWIRILLGESEKFDNQKESLESELLNAVAEENFERAAEIRDQLAII